MAALTLAPDTLPNGAVGVAYNQPLTASGGRAPYTITYDGGQPPVGVLLINGVLSGTPFQAGTFTFNVKVLDADLVSTIKTYTVVIAAQSITLAPAALPGGTVGNAYSQTLSASGGTSPYTYSVTAGALPPGLSLSAAGALTGTPSQAGTYSVNIEARDANLVTGTSTYSIVIAPAITITPTEGELPTASIGTAYNQVFTASGGTGPHTFAIVSGNLPAGLSLTSAGVLSGTPTATGTFTFGLQASDSGGQVSAVGTYTLIVAPYALTLVPDTLPNGAVGVAYNQPLTASGGHAPYLIRYEGGRPPLGVMLINNVMSGVPFEAGTYTFKVKVFDADLVSTIKTYTVVIAAQSITLAPSPAALPSGTVGNAYSQAFSASGGTSPYTYSVTAGALPPGLSLSAAGALTGTPTQAGTYSVNIEARDANLVTGTTTYFIVIAPAVAITPEAGELPTASIGTAYNQVFTASGGTGPHSFAIVSGNLPVGLSLTPAGVLSGTPMATGTFTFGLQASDSSAGGGQVSAVGTYTLVVAPYALTLVPTTLPNGVIGVAYNQPLTASGGRAPYSITYDGGSSPLGVLLINNVLSGIPFEAGTYTFGVRIRDADRVSVLKTYTVVIAEARPDPTLDPIVNGLVSAQVATTQRFARAQIRNFSERLQSLHGAGTDGGTSAFNLRFGNHSSMARANACDPAASHPRDRPRDLCRSLVSEDAGASPEMAPAERRGDWSVWSGGYINFGERDAKANQPGLEFDTEGVSLGADKRFSDRIIAGVGLGYGRDDSDIGDEGSHSNADGWTLALYGSLEPFDGAYLDGLAGYGSLDFETRRQVEGGFAEGQRDGDQWFASVAFGFDRRRAGWYVSPYVALAWSRAELDAFTEQSGDPDQALQFGRQSIDMLTSSLGLRTEKANERGWGTFTPYLRGEWRHDFHDAGTATLSYANWIGGPTYRLEAEEGDSSYAMLGLGFNARSKRGLFVELGYEVLMGSLNDSDQSVLLRVGSQF